MLEKVKTFFSQWLPFANQAIKREREPSVDDSGVNEPAPLNNQHAPFSKKLRLMPGTVQDMENCHPIASKKDLEGNEVTTNKWIDYLKNKALQTSTPGAVSSEPMKSRCLPDTTTEVVKTTHTIQSIHFVSQSVEDGTSLKQLEKLSKLGAADDTKPVKTIFTRPEPSLPFSFTPVVGRNKSQPGITLSRSGKSPADSIKKRITNGAVQKANYRPLHHKMFGSPKNQKTLAINNSFLRNRAGKMAVSNCFRMEDRQSYQALLAQFTPKIPVSVGKLIGTISSSSSSSRSCSALQIEKIDSKENSLFHQQLKKSSPSQVIDLENEPSSSTAHDLGTSAVQSPTPQVKDVIRVNSLEDALALSPQYDTQFVSQLKSRYSARERERKRQLLEEETRSKVLAENRNEWEEGLEERLRKQLAIGAKPVVDEREREPVSPVLPDITNEMQQVIDHSLNGHSEGEVLCDAYNLTITRRDLKTLAGLNWLNDQVINFYLTLIMERSNESTDLPKVYAFNTFFYPKLMSSGHAGLKRWTRKVDLFQQDFILIPVHLGLHWCLATVSPKEQAIRYYDSMGGRNVECLNALKRYMEEESKDKRKTPLDASSWTLDCVQNIPQQMNGSDCGMFACKYAEYVARRAKITFDQKDMPYFRKRMVYEIVTRKLIHP